jgi:hypothetical protein
MSKNGKNLAINLLCSGLVAAFLVAVPLLALAPGQEAVPGVAGMEIKPDPHHRLPSSPEEAHQRILEREVGWPAEGDSGPGFQAAAVEAGVRVALPFDTVEGPVSNAGADVKVELLRGSPPAVVAEVTVKAGDDGWFIADLSPADIQSGDLVRVTDLSGGASEVIDCTLDGVMDTDNDRVAGNAAPGTEVFVYIAAPSTYYGDIPPGAATATVPAPLGAYQADFPQINLRRGDAAYLYSFNLAGHTVMNVAENSGLGLVVYPQYDDVMGYYLPDADLTVNAGAASRNVKAGGDGFFEAWFVDHDIVPGEQVTCNMGGARSITVRDVSAKADPVNDTVSGTGPAGKEIRVTMDPYGVNPVVVESTIDADGSFQVDLGSRAYDVTGNEVFNITWYDNDGDCVVYEFQAYSWYLAEGYTGGDFDTWVLVQNPGADDAEVAMTFQLTEGAAPDYMLTVPAGARVSVHLDELPGLGDAQVSTTVTSMTGNWIIVERAVYFNYYGKTGGHDSVGTINHSQEWYLAEGYTGGDFDTWVLVQNPGVLPAQITLSFQLTEGTAPDYTFTLAGGTRESVHLDELPGLEDAQVSTRVTSDQPVVAERAVYFNYYGKTGGHDSVGVPELI